jgi:hypothetical protein
MKVITFTVTGKGRFPNDMLRHDQCFPCDGIAVHNTEGDSWAIRSVKLISIASSGITSLRWASFGWYVDEDSIKVYNDYTS